MSPAVNKRRFAVHIAQDWLQIADGMTAELSQVVEVAAHWKGGASYDSLSARYPFMRVTELARVLASPDPIAAQWDWLRSAPEFCDDRDLVDAAHRDPVLRSYFPDLSHRSLQLSRSFTDREGAVRISLQDGGYRVQQSGESSQGREYASIEAAVAAASELLAPRPQGSDSPDGERLPPGED
ncbi:hypothetical protein ALMP_82920 [Streptomyces sp. A012304]|nr:hypothetical protein ALMP_82920 [Streptomyces sp. A012304]